MSYRVTLTHDPNVLMGLQAEWESLQAQSYAWCVFSTWEWSRTWWEHFGAGAELWLLLAHDADQTLVGIAPLMLTRASRLPGLTWRQLQFLSSGMNNDHLDFIIREGAEREVIAAFLEVLNAEHKRWDVLRLENVTENSPTLATLRSSGQDWKTEAIEPSPFIALPATWDEHFNNLSYLKRKHQRRAMRKVEKDFEGRWSVDTVMRRDEIDDAFATLARLHQSRWEGTDQPGAFGDAKVRAFYAEIARRFVENGRLRLYRLWLGDDIAASFFGFFYRGRHFDFASGIDYSLQKYDPGHILTECMLKDAIANGVVEYDFLLGDEEYKYRWGAANRYDHTIIWHQSLRARLQYALYQSLRWAKAQGRRLRRSRQAPPPPNSTEQSDENPA